MGQLVIICKRPSEQVFDPEAEQVKMGRQACLE